MSRFEETIIVDGVTGDQAGVNSEGRLDVVQHQHPDGGHIYFRDDISVTTDYILIDLSDTTNYPHNSTNHIHTENISVVIDATNTADYVVELGFLENVDGTDGDFIEIFTFSGTKQAGNNQAFEISQAPNGARLISSRFTSAVMSLNDVAFQTDVNLASTLDPATADTPSGNGDMVIRVTINAGSIDLSIAVGYHSHA